MISGPEFVKLMEEYGIQPKDLGISRNYKFLLKQGIRRPSRKLIMKLERLIRERSPDDFVELMEECGLKPKDLGITSNYKCKLARGLRKPSKELVEKLITACIKRFNLDEGPIDNLSDDKHNNYIITTLLSNLERIKVNIEEFMQFLHSASSVLQEKINEINSRLDKIEVVNYNDMNIKDVFIGLVKGREVLETVVANVLKDFGFTVSTNVIVPAIIGSHIELDVLGKVVVDSIPTYIYASCKNLSKSVNRDIIVNELGRIALLPFKPHVMLFVASHIDKHARTIASKAGFIVVEVGFKVTKDNEAIAYEILKKKLTPLFSPKCKKSTK